MASVTKAHTSYQSNYDYADYYSGNDENGLLCNKSEIKEFGSVFLPILYSLVVTVGFVGNSLVVFVLLKYLNQANLTDICLLNLAIADLLFVISLPFFAHYAYAADWIFGNFVCRFSNALYSVGFYGSVLFLVMMTLDRYIVIVHSHTGARHRTVKVGISLSLFVWLLSLLASLPTLVFTEAKHNDSVWTCNTSFPNSFWEQFNYLEINLLSLMIPLLVMVFCYFRIILTLVGIKSTKRHRAIRLIVIVVVTFFCFWTPYNIVLFLRYLQLTKLYEQTCDEEKALDLVVKVTESLGFTHCCLNPIIYAFVGQKFMQRVRKLLRKWMPWCLPASSRNLPESSSRKASTVSRSSEVTSVNFM